MTQASYLRSAQAALGLSRKDLALAIDAAPRRLDNWFLPEDSSGHRRMPQQVKARIDALLVQRARKDRQGMDWVQGARQLRRQTKARGAQAIDWDALQGVIAAAVDAEQQWLRIGLMAVLEWRASGGAGQPPSPASSALRAIAAQVRLVVERSPSLLRGLAGELSQVDAIGQLLDQVEQR